MQEIERIEQELQEVAKKIEDIEDEMMGFRITNQSIETYEEKYDVLLKRADFYVRYQFVLDNIVYKLHKKLKKWKIYSPLRSHFIHKLDDYVDNLKSDFEMYSERHKRSSKQLRRLLRVLYIKMIILVFHIKFPQGCDESHIDYEASKNASENLQYDFFTRFSNLFNNNEKCIKINRIYSGLLNEVLEMKY